jgi:hypothetical protein
MVVGVPQPGAPARAAEDLAVPAFVIGAAVSRARRSLARSRRIPGLPLIVLRAFHVHAKTAIPRVPALPWGAGLSHLWLWERTRGDTEPGGGPGILGFSSRAPAAAMMAALPQSRSDREYAADERASPVSTEHPSRAVSSASRPPAGSADSVGPTIRSAPIARDDERDAPRVLPSAIGLEGVAPALVLVRSMLGAPFRAGAGTSPEHRLPTRGAVRPDRGQWGFALDVAATRGTRLPVALSRGGLAPAAAAAQVASSDDTVTPPGEAPLAPEVETRFASYPDAAPALLHQVPALSRGEHSVPTSREHDRASNRAEEDRSLPWPAPQATASSHDDNGTQREQPSSPYGVVASLPWLRQEGSAPPPALTSRDALAGHRLPARAATGTQRSALDAALPFVSGDSEHGTNGSSRTPVLPQREVSAAPAALRSVVDMTETLRTYVVREVQEVKRALAEVARRPPPADIGASDDVARKLLNRMRTLTEEERFRSGKLR